MSKINNLISRCFSVFTRKPKKTYGYYAIISAVPGGFQYNSADFVINNFNSSNVMKELFEFIEKKHNIEKFTIVTLVFFPK